jgi:hypothetical protein
LADQSECKVADALADEFPAARSASFARVDATFGTRSGFLAVPGGKAAIPGESLAASGALAAAASSGRKAHKTSFATRGESFFTAIALFARGGERFTRDSRERGANGEYRFEGAFYGNERSRGLCNATLCCKTGRMFAGDVSQRGGSGGGKAARPRPYCGKDTRKSGAAGGKEANPSQSPIKRGRV